ncbi:MAG: glycerate kinase [Pyrinomonadaceae bacterium]
MVKNRDLARTARRIFDEALKTADPGNAVRETVRTEGRFLFARNERNGIDLTRPLYAVAIGKAAYPMAAAFEKAIGTYLTAGVVSGTENVPGGQDLGPKWEKFSGGHPLPNEESLGAARACLAMLDRACAEKAGVVFLISGGGSAMMELPRDPAVTLDDLRNLNHALVTSGASIAEINSVRRSVSAVKGGGLALRAPDSPQISLIISDTRAGDVSSVASGPSLIPDDTVPDPLTVVDKYSLTGSLPPSLLRSLEQDSVEPSFRLTDNRAYVLLDNKTMVTRAAEIAEGLGFVTGYDPAEHDEMIEEGIVSLFTRALDFKRSVPPGKPVCYISGGEFGCEVKGSGVGGRNCESALRAALRAEKNPELHNFAFLSAGTDGIDGNSSAAGGVVDENTLESAIARGLDPREYLTNSDSFTFLKKLNAAIETGPTGTNVRDVRIILSA